MRRPFKIFALLLVASLSLSVLVSCFDMGEGDGEDSFKSYFSGVFLISDKGVSKQSIADFNRNINLENVSIEQIVDFGQYAYICFKAANDYRLEVEELAFFAKTNGGKATLALEFYIIDKIPTKIESENETVYLPPEGEQNTQQTEYRPPTDDEGNPQEREDEIGEDIFSSENAYCSTSMSVSDEWDSVLFSFSQKQTVEPGHYIVVRVKNNCLIDGEMENPVNFTFNYLIFRFSRATKV